MLKIKCLTIKILYIIILISYSSTTQGFNINNPFKYPNSFAIEKTLSCYLNPTYIDKDALNFEHSMALLPVIPGDLILQILDISSTGEVLDKSLVYNSLVNEFPKEKFNYSALMVLLCLTYQNQKLMVSLRS